MGIIQNGCRTYLAVCGGIKTEKILESRSQFKGVTVNDRIFKKTLLPIDNPIFNPSNLSASNFLVHMSTCFSSPTIW